VFSVPEIADYEVRRELIRAGQTRGVQRLDLLCEGFNYLPLTTEIMRIAAELWATARNAGTPTASDAALDADVILAAQAMVLRNEHVVLRPQTPSTWNGSSKSNSGARRDNADHASRWRSATAQSSMPPLGRCVSVTVTRLQAAVVKISSAIAAASASANIGRSRNRQR